MIEKIIDGKQIALNLRQDIKAKVALLPSAPGLAVVLVGDDAASSVYVASKEKACLEAGIASFPHKLPSNTSENDLLDLIIALNNNPKVHGILVQLPLPKHINETLVLEAIDPKKDVDGFHPVNQGKLMSGVGHLIPCTPLGCLMMLKQTLGNLTGLNALVVGRSNIVGKPMAMLLLNESATVTVAHSKTRNLKELCLAADIIVAAVGRPLLIKGEWIKQGATVIDVGINRIPAPEKGEGKTRLVGDVDFNAALLTAAHITPVPGGVGPMTIACLLNNTVMAYEVLQSSKH